MEARNKNAIALENNKAAYIAKVKSLTNWPNVEKFIHTDIMTKIKMGLDVDNEEDKNPLINTAIDDEQNPTLHFYIKQLKNYPQYKANLEYSIAQSLKLHRADFSIKNTNKQNALDLALEVGESCIELIQQNLMGEDNKIKFQQEIEFARARHINSKPIVSKSITDDTKSALYNAVAVGDYSAITKIMDASDEPITIPFEVQNNDKTPIGLAIEKNDEEAIRLIQDSLIRPFHKKVFITELLKERILNAVETKNEINAVKYYNEYYTKFSYNLTLDFIRRILNKAKIVDSEFLIKIFEKQLNVRVELIEPKDYAIRSESKAEVKAEIKPAPSINDARNRLYTLIKTNDFNNTSEISTLLKIYPINTQDKEFGSLLHLAVFYINVEMVKFLMANGANWNLNDKDGVTPLQMAVENENTVTLDVMSNFIITQGNSSEVQKFFDEKDAAESKRRKDKNEVKQQAPVQAVKVANNSIFNANVNKNANSLSVTINKNDHIKFYGVIDTSQAKQKLLALQQQGIETPYALRYSDTVSQIIITRLVNGVAENLPTHAFLDPNHKVNFANEKEIDILVKSIIKTIDYMLMHKLRFRDSPEQYLAITQLQEVKPASIFFINDTEYGQQYIKQANKKAEVEVKQEQAKKEEIKTPQAKDNQASKPGLFNNNNHSESDSDDEEDIDEFTCKITLEIMKDPVLCTLEDGGISYERVALQAALEKQKQSPIEHKPLGDKKIEDVIRPNVALKNAIRRWEKKKTKKEANKNSMQKVMP